MLLATTSTDSKCRVFSAFIKGVDAKLVFHHDIIHKKYKLFSLSCKDSASIVLVEGRWLGDKQETARKHTNYSIQCGPHYFLGLNSVDPT